MIAKLRWNGAFARILACHSSALPSHETLSTRRSQWRLASFRITRSRFSAITLSVVIAGLASTPTSAAQYTVTDLGTLGGTTSFATAINASGQITGYAQIGFRNHAFRYENGVMHDLGVLPGGETSRGYAINASGQVGGDAGTSGESFPHAVLHDGSTLIDLGTLGGSLSQAYGINSSGDLVGYSRLGNADYAFLYSGGTMLQISSLQGSAAWAINDAGQVAGGVPGLGGKKAFIYSGGSTTVLGTLGGTISEARAINASGQVVGLSTVDVDNDYYHGFLYSDGVMHDLGTVDDYSNFALAINNNGIIVGELRESLGLGALSGAIHGFIYDGQVMTDINDLIAPNSGWTITTLTGVNDSGLIVGAGTYDPDGPGGIDAVSHAVLLTPVPEPGSAILAFLACCAMSGFGAFQARRRASTPK